MPKQCRPNRLFAEAGTERDIRVSLDDRVQKNGQLRRAVTVVAIEEHDDIGRICFGQPRKTRPPISAARFPNDTGPHACSNLWRSVVLVAVDYDYLRDE